MEDPGAVSLNPQDLVEHLQIHGRLHELVESLREERALLDLVRESKLETSTPELQQALDLERRRLGLHNAGKTRSFLDRAGLTYEQFEIRIERQLLREKLKQSLVADRVEPYYRDHPREFEYAVLHRIVVKEPSLARELRCQIEEGETSFEDLALRHSLDRDSGRVGGFWGRFTRDELPAALAPAIFSAGPGLRGPLEADGHQHLVRVDHRGRTPLEPATREEIAEKLLRAALREVMERTRGHFSR